MAKITVVINSHDEQFVIKDMDSENLREKVHYFQGLFSFEDVKENIKLEESKITKYELEFNFGHHLKAIIEYLLKFPLKITPDLNPNTHPITFLNVVEMMYTSTYFQSDSFFKLCVKFLLDNLHYLPSISKKKLINDILEHHDLLLPIDELYPKITEFFLSKGLTEETGNLPLGLITSILKSDELQVESENHVANFISRYLQQHPNFELSTELFSCIRFKTQTFEKSKFPEFLKAKLTDELNSAFQDGNFDKILTAEQIEDIHFLRPGSLGYLLLVSDNRIDIFSKADNNGLGKWFQYKNLNNSKICQGSVSYDIEKSVISWRGGMDIQSCEENDGIVSLNLLDGELTTVKDDSVFTNSAHVTISNGQHFDFGGFKSNNISIKSEFLPEYLFPAACKISETKIIVSGGLNSKTCFSTSNSYMFCTKTKIITDISPMTMVRHKHKLVLLKNRVYAVGGSKTDETVKEEALSDCEYYDLSLNEWVAMRSMNKARKHPGVTCVLDTICVVGGLDSATGHTTINMEVYTSDTDEWHMVEGKGSELKGGARRFPNLFWIPPAKLDTSILDGAKTYSLKLGEELELTTQQIWDLHF